MKIKEIREIIRGIIREGAKEKLVNSLSGITKSNSPNHPISPGGIEVDEGNLTYLTGVALPVIEQTTIESNEIKELIDNLLILKDKYMGGEGLAREPEEVQRAIGYLSSENALKALNLVTDIEEACGAISVGGRSLKFDPELSGE